MIVWGRALDAPTLTREQHIESAEDRAEQVAFDAARERT